MMHHFRGIVSGASSSSTLADRVIRTGDCRRSMKVLHTYLPVPDGSQD